MKRIITIAFVCLLSGCAAVPIEERSISDLCETYSLEPMFAPGFKKMQEDIRAEIHRRADAGDLELDEAALLCAKGQPGLHQL